MVASAAQLNSLDLHLSSAPVLAVREGHVATMTAQVARESGAELIVMGAQHKRPLAPIRGTTAERVVALAQRPVLIITSKGAAAL